MSINIISFQPFLELSASSHGLPQQILLEGFEQTPGAEEDDVKTNIYSSNEMKLSDFTGLNPLINK